MSETGGYSVILADDHVLIRRGLRKIIEGVDDLEVVGEAGDGEELLEMLESTSPRLVILDISMPKLRGIEAIRLIRKKSADVKVLVLTMHREYLHQALSAGADGYMVKEDAERELFRAINAIRHKKRYVSPLLMRELPENDTEPLSVRETEVLKLIVQGKSNRDIAADLFISVRTAEAHRASLHAKLRCKSTADLVKFAIEKGYT